jgi:hypothetical protein
MATSTPSVPKPGGFGRTLHDRVQKDKTMFKYLAIAFLATAGTASAQQLTMQDKLALRDNCKQDFQRLCPANKPGDGKLMGCIQQQKDKLSPACSATIAEVMSKRKN